MTDDIAARFRARRKRQDPRTESLLRSIATVFINSRGGSSTCARNVSFTCGGTGDKELAKQSDAKSAALSVSFPAEPLTVCARPRQKNINPRPWRSPMTREPSHTTEKSTTCTGRPVPILSWDAGNDLETKETAALLPYNRF